MPEVTIAPQSSPLGGRLPAALVLMLVALAGFLPHPIALPVLTAQQTIRLRADTPFHTEPDGTRLGAVLSGTTVRPGRTRGEWRQVTFEGWVFTASTGASTRREFDLMITASNGENVRAEPDGALVARAVRGTGFTRVSRRGGWTQVRRTAWVPVSALRAERPAQVAARPAPPPTPAPPQADSAPPAVPVAERVILKQGAALAVSPGGPAVGSAPEDIAGEVTARSGNWVRLRSEMWVRAEDVRAAATDSSAITLEMLRSNPDRYVGQRVGWRLQFLSVQVADELRPELPPGQPYLLTRGPLPEVGFVYVAVTNEQAQRFRAMNPLDEFLARGTIRAARTRYLPTPVLELER